MSTDVLGHGRRGRSPACRSPTSCRQHVLDPLGMSETTWYVADDRADRLAALYTPTPGHRQGDALRRDGRAAPARRRRPRWAAAGCAATAGDYLRFAEMLRRRGELDGVRAARPRRRSTTWPATTCPATPTSRTFGRPLFSETTFDGVGFGLGVSVTHRPGDGRRCPAASATTAGAARRAPPTGSTRSSTSSCVFMTQLLPSNSLPLRSQLRQLVHAAILDP